MKVAVLQWCESVDRGLGTVERISTTAEDCINFFKTQMEGFYLSHFQMCDNGQLAIIDPKCRQGFERIIEDDYEELKKFVQQLFEWDQLNTIYIRGTHEKLDCHWWKIQFRNLH